MSFYLFLTLLLLSSGCYYLGRRRAFSVAGDHVRNLHSLPSYYGADTARWGGLPTLLVFAAWTALQPSIILELVANALPPDPAGPPAACAALAAARWSPVRE